MKRGSAAAGVIALLVLALALGGGLVGHRMAEQARPGPERFAAAPAPAASPSYPVTPAVVLPDDSYPALRPGVRLKYAALGSPPFTVRVPVPRGWVRSVPMDGEWRWYPAPDKTENIYFLRVRTIGVQYQSVPAALKSRIEALQKAEGVDEFVVERRGADRFVSRYVADDHRRVAFEGYLPRGEVAHLWVAVIGREADRRGLRSLFERIMTGARVS